MGYSYAIKCCFFMNIPNIQMFGPRKSLLLWRVCVPHISNILVLAAARTCTGYDSLRPRCGNSNLGGREWVGI